MEIEILYLLRPNGKPIIGCTGFVKIGVSAPVFFDEGGIHRGSYGRSDGYLA